MRLWIASVICLVLATPAGAAGDPARGEEIYSRCLACHSPDRNRTGPKHCDLIGRKAGTAPGFSYSKAMRQSNIVWDDQSLDRFLAAPPRAMPGTTMTYAGIKPAQERADLIAYLATLHCD